MKNKCILGAIMTETALLLEVLVVVAYSTWIAIATHFQ